MARSVTFLELFYDLVYVVLIAQLAHALSEHVDLKGIFGFAFLFIIVWWAWLNGASYHDYHGNNDIRSRVFTFLQMRNGNCEFGNFQTTLNIPLCIRYCFSMFTC